MPFVIDEICETCKEPVEFELHPDGSVKAARCRCQGPGYEPGRAYSRGVFALWLFKARTAIAITERLGWHEANLRGWKERHGYLLPTEPCQEERESVRRELKAAIHVLTELRLEIGLET